MTDVAFLLSRRILEHLLEGSRVFPPSLTGSVYVNFSPPSVVGEEIIQRRLDWIRRNRDVRL